MIMTIVVKWGTEWGCEIEVDEDSTLDDIHMAIQNAVRFDNDHMYEFYIARTERTRNRESYDQESEAVYDTKIKDLFPLPPKMQLFYLFDYGDSWLFKVSRSRKAPHAPVPKAKYPKVVSETGKRPKQYT